MNPLIVANWKTNKTLAEAVTYVQAAGESLDQLKGIEIVICPPLIALPVLEGLLRDSSISLGAQDVSVWKNGSHTGEVSAEQIAPHAKYTIIGHSERRQGMGETDEQVNRKVRRAVEAGLQPIVCVSNMQELESLESVKNKVSQWIIAYEPLEAIGSGQPSKPKDVEVMVKAIKKKFKKSRVLYGGSVDLENVKTYLKVSDGSLVGGASLDPRNFLDLCATAAK